MTRRISEEVEEPGSFRAPFHLVRLFQSLGNIQASAIHEFKGALDFLADLRTEFRATHTDHVKPPNFAVLRAEGVGWTILIDRSMALNHAEIPNPAELVKPSPSTEEASVADMNVTCYHAEVGHDVVIANLRIVADMGAHH